MGPINECCNPLKKTKHNHVRSNLILIQKKRNAKFKKFINLYMCKPCEKAVYKLSESELNSISIEKVVKMKESENVCVDVCEKEIVSDPEDFSDADDAILDPNFEVDDEQKNLTCIEKINEILNDLVEPPIKKRHSNQLTKKDKQSIKTVINNLIDGNITSTVDSEDPNQMFVNVIKEALSKEETRSGKIKVLTTLPADWSTKKIRREFNVSRRMVSRAKALAANSGFASEPPKKKGKKLSESTRENVVIFYLSDDISRVMPGMKDCISVVKDGQKIRVQKRLLLFNMKDLHEQYQEKFPEANIGLTKFQKLKPPECIAAGQSGTHNVCVCKIHQNIRLKLFGLKKELKKHEISFVEKCDDLIRASVCEISTPACFLSTCRVCPGIQVIIERLKKQLDDNNIQEIPYTQWTSTDRYRTF